MEEKTVNTVSNKNGSDTCLLENAQCMCKQLWVLCPVVYRADNASFAQ